MMWLLLIVLSLAELVNCEPIVNGDDVTVMRYPYVVYLLILGMEIDPETQNEKKYAAECTGSLIHKNIVLTAAHCLTSTIAPPEVRVFGGQVIKPAIEVGYNHPAKVWSMTDYITHVLYPARLMVDVALVYLREVNSKAGLNYPVTIGQFGQLPLDGTRVTLTGWGLMKDNEESTILQEGTMVISERDIYGPGNWDYKYYIELKDSERYVTGCSGDSGGPIIHEGKIVAVFVNSASANKIINGRHESACREGGPAFGIRYDRIRSWIDINVPRKNTEESWTLLNAIEPNFFVG